MKPTTDKNSVMYYLPIIIAICSIAVAWGIYSTKITDAESQIVEIKQSQAQNDASVALQLTSLQVDVSSIKTSVDFIKNQYQK